MGQAVLIVIGVGIIAMLAVIAYQNHRRFHRPLLTTPYQAVMLTNGTLLYGRIDHLGSDHPVLRDVFSVRQEPDSQTQTQQYALVKRKDEANGADHMIFPVTSIVFIEPVQLDSTIGKLMGGQVSPVRSLLGADRDSFRGQPTTRPKSDDADAGRR